MLRMEQKLTPTVITSAGHVAAARQFGRILRTLRILAGWSQQRAGAEYHCAGALVSFREAGRRNLTVPDAVAVLARHGYVLVVMHRDDAADVPRLMLDDDAAAVRQA